MLEHIQSFYRESDRSMDGTNVGTELWIIQSTVKSDKLVFHLPKKATLLFITTPSLSSAEARQRGGSGIFEIFEFMALVAVPEIGLLPARLKMFYTVYTAIGSVHPYLPYRAIHRKGDCSTFFRRF